VLGSQFPTKDIPLLEHSDELVAADAKALNGWACLILISTHRLWVHKHLDEIKFEVTDRCNLACTFCIKTSGEGGTTTLDMEVLNVF